MIIKKFTVNNGLFYTLKVVFPENIDKHLLNNLENRVINFFENNHFEECIDINVCESLDDANHVGFCIETLDEEVFKVIDAYLRETNGYVFVFGSGGHVLEISRNRYYYDDFESFEMGIHFEMAERQQKSMYQILTKDEVNL